MHLHIVVYEALTALNFHAFFQWCSNEDGVANVDERFWQELADTHAAFYNHNNAVDLSKLSILFREQPNNTPASLQVFNDGFLGRNITPLPIERASCLFDGKFARHEFFLNVIW
jgi:hypothetical protein